MLPESELRYLCQRSQKPASLEVCRGEGTPFLGWFGAGSRLGKAIHQRTLVLDANDGRACVWDGQLEPAGGPLLTFCCGF